MSADKYLALDMWSTSALHALDYVQSDVANALHNLDQQFGEMHMVEVRDALIATLAQIDIAATEIRETAVLEDVEHQLHELGADDSEEAAE